MLEQLGKSLEQKSYYYIIHEFEFPRRSLTAQNYYLILYFLFPDMRKDVQEIFRATPHEKQVMMFSATLSKEIRPVCKKFMQDVCTFQKLLGLGFLSTFSDPRRIEETTLAIGVILSIVIICSCSYFLELGVSEERRRRRRVEEQERRKLGWGGWEISGNK